MGKGAGVRLRPWRERFPLEDVVVRVLLVTWLSWGAVLGIVMGNVVWREWGGGSADQAGAGDQVGGEEVEPEVCREVRALLGRLGCGVGDPVGAVADEVGLVVGPDGRVVRCGVMQCDRVGGAETLGR